MVRPIVDFFCEAMANWVEHFQLLFIMAVTALALVWVTAPRVESWAWAERLESWYFMLLGAWKDNDDWRWCFLLLSSDSTDLSRFLQYLQSCCLRRSIRLCLKFSIMLSTSIYNALFEIFNHVFYAASAWFFTPYQEWWEHNLIKNSWVETESISPQVTLIWASSWLRWTQVPLQWQRRAQ